MFDVAVVGAGLIGAAAARYLAASGAQVALIGPPEPDRPKSHDGVFSSHYDRTRIVRRTTRDMLWATLAHRSLAGMRALERATGITILTPRAGVHLAPHGQPSVFIAAAAEIARAFDVRYQALDNLAQVIREVPALGLNEPVYGMIEYPPAGFLDPRALIRAQMCQAVHDRAVVIPTIVDRVRPSHDGVVVITRDAQRIRARQVLVAAGAYSADRTLLPRPLDLQVKSETVLLARVSEAEAERLSEFPSLVYESERAQLDTFYMVPPVRYPDQHHYIKMGCNTFADRLLHTPGEMSQWVRSGASTVAEANMLLALRHLIRDLTVTATTTKRCLITYTPNGWPMVDQVDDHIFVATGGNGLGAKSSDAIGALAAELTLHGSVRDPGIDLSRVRAQFADSDRRLIKSESALPAEAKSVPPAEAAPAPPAEAESALPAEVESALPAEVGSAPPAEAAPAPPAEAESTPPTKPEPIVQRPFGQPGLIRTRPS